METPRVLPVNALMACDPQAAERARRALSGRFGAPLLQSELFDFDFTDYYVSQTGPAAVKQFLIHPPAVGEPDLAAWKRWAVECEADLRGELRASVPRPVNLDPGILSLGNLVLASTKEAGHRVHLKDGIHAQLELLWEHGAFSPLPWTYPDYRTPEALALFARARALLKRMTREGR
jgi:hypothetical protein